MSFDWSTLRTDRSQDDVEEANRLVQKYLNNEELTSEEQELWDAGLYGRYGYIDFNRVGYAINELAEEFNNLAISNKIVALTNYVNTSDLNPEVTALYLDTIAQIQDVIPLPDNTPNIPESMEDFTLDSANDIERILSIINYLQHCIKSAFQHCGVTTCGLGGLII